MYRNIIKKIVLGLIIGLLLSIISYFLFPKYWPTPREALGFNSFFGAIKSFL